MTVHASIVYMAINIIVISNVMAILNGIMTILVLVLVLMPVSVSVDSRVRVTPRIRPPRLIVFIASRSFLGLFFRFNQEMFRTWFPKNLGRDGEEEAKS